MFVQTVTERLLRLQNVIKPFGALPFRTRPCI